MSEVVAAKHKNVRFDKYIIAHETSSNWEEISQKTGLAVASCKQKMYSFRKKGIPLKDIEGGGMRGGKKLDIPAALGLLESIRSQGVQS